MITTPIMTRAIVAGVSHSDNFEGVAFRMESLLYFLTSLRVSKLTGLETAARPFNLPVWGL
jgi:hypothetical protein